MSCSAAIFKTAPTALVYASAINNVKKTINAGKTYTVDFGYDANSGFIVAVGIVAK